MSLARLGRRGGGKQHVVCLLAGLRRRWDWGNNIVGKAVIIIVIGVI